MGGGCQNLCDFLFYIHLIERVFDKQTLISESASEVPANGTALPVPKVGEVKQGSQTDIKPQVDFQCYTCETGAGGTTCSEPRFCADQRCHFIVGELSENGKTCKK